MRRLKLLKKKGYVYRSYENWLFDGYRVKLLFNNDETRIVDLYLSLDGAIFAPLKDLEFLIHFTIKFNIIEWENGAYFAPEYLNMMAA